MSDAEAVPIPLDPDTDFLEADEGILIAPDTVEGDKRVKWKMGDAVSIANAKKRFEELVAKGYTVIRLDRPKATRIKIPKAARPTGRGTAEVVPKFKPAPAEHHAIPPARGG